MLDINEKNLVSQATQVIFTDIPNIVNQYWLIFITIAINSAEEINMSNFKSVSSLQILYY